jgi:fermentation-respiration switch protein FrsA (DUF1100 family)
MARVRRRVLVVAVSILVTLVVLMLAVRGLEPQMAFYPIAGVQDTPAAVSLSFVDLRIPTEDGETLHGWWLEHPRPRAQVIFWHGNGGNLSLWLDLIAELRRRGFSVLAVDYRGYGASTGRPTERGLYRDARATLDVFMRRFRQPDVPILYWGRSIGCPVAASMLPVAQPDGLILDSPMADVRSVLRTNPVMWLLSFLMSYRFPTSELVQQYRGPLLVVHGERDSIVPFASGQRVFAESPSPLKVFVTIPGADHNDLDAADPQRYWRGVDDFLEMLPKARQQPSR